MKTARITGLECIQIQEVPAPELFSDSDVLVRVKAVGLCGSDLHYYRVGRIGDQIVQFPFTTGHECAGFVEKAGKAALSSLSPGDRVAVQPAVSCGTCSQCRSGRRNTCLNLKFVGCPGELEGALSEYLVLPAVNCFKIPEALTEVQAALAEPLSIGLYAVDFLEESDHTKVAVLGTGPIGLSIVLACRARGISNIRATDKIPERSRAARRAGAVWTGNPRCSDIVGEILEQEPEGLDAVFECCGDQAALDQAVDLLKPGGDLILIGIPEVDRISFDINRTRRKEIRIQNIRRQRGCFAQAVRMISEGIVDVNFLITHVFSLEDVAEAFDLVSHYRDGVIKAVIRM